MQAHPIGDVLLCSPSMANNTLVKARLDRIYSGPFDDLLERKSGMHTSCADHPRLKMSAHHSLRYNYQPLSVASSEIRILKLDCSQVTDGIECELEHVFLQNSPQFDALSYTWGPNVFSQSILCGGRSLAVTESLHAALLELRRSQYTYIWIDAVCINQQNVSERNAQVAIMSDIYRAARRVVVWLGSSSASDSLAFKAIQEMQTELQKWTAQREREKGPDPVFENAIDRDYQEFYTGFKHIHSPLWAEGSEVWKCLSHLAQRPWFRRIWIIQEVALARNAIVKCGVFEIGFPTFVQTYAVIRGSAFQTRLNGYGDHNDGVNQMTQIEKIRAALDTAGAWKLNRIMPNTRSSLATDPRDKIFGVLGLAADHHAREFPVDYEIDTVTLYKLFTAFCIEQTGSYDILSTFPVAPELNRLVGLPTWVPDYSGIEECHPITTRFPSAYNAGKNTMMQATFSSNGDVLTITGTVLDSIKEVSPPIANATPADHGERMKVLLGVLERCEKMVANCPDPYFNGATRIEAYWRTLLLDLLADGSRPDPTYEETYLKYRHTVPLLAEDFHAFARLDKETIGGFMRFNQDFGHKGLGVYRVLATTQSGFMALVPPATQIGDIVFVPLGGKVALTVRSTSRDAVFTHVGESYVHGFNNGEAFKTTGAKLESIELI